MKAKIIENIKNRILAEKRKHETTQFNSKEWAKIAAAKIVSEYNIDSLYSGGIDRNIISDAMDKLAMAVVNEKEVDVSTHVDELHSNLSHPTPDNSENHGMWGTKFYNLWWGMKSRCNNKNAANYHLYGGRGIKIHEDWENNFTAFYDYVTHLEYYGESGRSLDRINNEGNYEPGNVRWATPHEQNVKRRFPKNNISGYTGVSFLKREEKYQSKIKVNGKVFYLGHHETPEAAATARDEYIILNELWEYPLQILTKPVTEISEGEIKKAAAKYEADCRCEHPEIESDNWYFDYVNEDFEAGVKWALSKGALIKNAANKDIYENLKPISEGEIEELWKKYKGKFLAIFNRADFGAFIKELNNSHI